ncbi:MAG: class D sortase [Chloroflexi bacterium]|nr:class D sortase [Chloroflexota bacterium]
MRDKRPVDELSIEELERVLAIRRREERHKQMQRMQRTGRVLAQNESLSSSALPAAPGVSSADLPVKLSVSAAGQSPRFEDEPGSGDYDALNSEENKRTWRNFVNRSLLLVEVLAVVGLVVLGVNLFGAITALERETASAAQLADEQRRAGIPTLEPTPVLRLDQIVLPGGHVYVEGATPQFNYAEIPRHLLASVQSMVMQPVLARPPQTSETALILSIDKLDLDQTIVQGVDWEALRMGIGQLTNGVNPGDNSGNVVLAAHNDIYGEYFRYLDRLAPGDRFTIQTSTHVYTYVVTEIQLVAPTDVHVMDNRAGATATLISCYPYQQNTQRIVVFADRIDT